MRLVLMLHFLLISTLGLSACGSHRGESVPADKSPHPTTRSNVADQPAENGPEEIKKSASPEPAPGGTASSAKRALTRDLLAEAGRAELDAGGLLIDIGSLDMHKYSRGAWLSGWSRNRLDGKKSVASIDEASAFLDVVLDEPAAEIVLHARGRGKLALSVDRGRATSTVLDKNYGTHRIAMGKSLEAGRHRIHLKGKGSSVDWIWFSKSAGAPVPPLARTKARSLLAPTPRSYRYYLIPGAGSRLDFATQGGAGASLQVLAEADGAAPVTLLESPAGQAHSIALDRFAGRPIKLTLRSLGGSISWMAPKITRAATRKRSSSTRAKNLIILLIDTQRADSFSVVNPKGAVGASNYEALVQSSTTFKNAYDNENWTKPSIVTLDTSLYPDSHLARWRKDKVASDLVFLSEYLQGKGFATAAMVSNMTAGAKFGFDQGWDLFEKTEDAEQAFGRATQWLGARKKDKRFFLYLQTIDPHVPFSVPKGAAEKLYGGEYKGPLGPSFEQSEEDALNAGKLKLTANDARWLQALYDAEVMYHDEHLGLFVDTLRKAGTLKDTAFVILNDHGEEFGEHGRYGHGWSMGDALFRSPLLMHLPGLFPAKTFDQVVEHLDVAPTVVDALDLPAMPSAHGQSLLPLIEGRENAERAPYSALLFGRPKQRAIRIGDYKLVLKSDREQSLFDLVRDPGETVDLIDKAPIALRLCELALGEAIANPEREERRSDRSQLPKIRAEYIDE